LKNKIDINKFLIKVAITILIGLSLLSIYSIVLVFKDKLFCLKIDLLNEYSLRFFLSSFEDYKIIYGTTLAIFSIYWSISSFSISSKDKSLADEFDTCSYYVNQVIPIISKLISELVEHKLISLEDCSNKSFTSEEFRKSNQINFEKTFTFLENKQIKINNIEALTCLEYFAYRILHSKFKGEIAFGILGKAYVSQVSALYSVISVTRSNEDSKNHFNSVITLFEKWSKKLAD